MLRKKRDDYIEDNDELKRYNLNKKIKSLLSTIESKKGIRKIR
ncbi:MAG TPA: hypothetical protein VE524_06440 [Nitrososphaeraceae archaeon]|nr:hypothetical protein [Nitrososphaeraceae archaeon]